MHKAILAPLAKLTVLAVFAGCGQVVTAGQTEAHDAALDDAQTALADGAPYDGSLADVASTDGADMGTDIDTIALVETAAGDADGEVTSCEFPAKPSPGEPGYPCNVPADCESGYCLEGPTGKICSKACVDCCPTGFQCEPFGASGDLTFVCAPKWTALCRPCDKDAECASAGKDALCVSYGETGSFCAAACLTNADCPTEYTCQDAAGEKGAAKQCVRSVGECGCSKSAIAAGAHTTCHHQNESGTCSGVRKCTTSGLTACPAAVPANEMCGNAVDDDCNGQTDENSATGCVTYYPDGDGDGDGLLGSAGLCQCASTSLYHATTATDCNDVDSKLNQWAVEVCDGVDNNCNAKTDEGCDDDGDGYCDANLLYFPAPICPKGGNDCDDASAKVHPNVLEICGNDTDDNCDGATDAGSDVAGCVAFYADTDGDGYGSGAAACLCAAKGLFTAQKSGDCDDASAAVHPGQPDVCGNAKDDNCNGAADEADGAGCVLYFADVDGDGYGAGAAACLCAPDAVYAATKGGDCDDGKASIHPKAIESCNGADDNCDGMTDEADATGCSTFYVDADGDTFGDPGTGLCLCAKTTLSTTALGGDCDDAQSQVHPGATETCNSLDDNCDGSTDEQNAVNCKMYYADQDSDGFGSAATAACLCAAAGGYKATTTGDCNDTNADIYPGALEVCDGVDNNCKNGADELNTTGCKIFYKDADADGFGQTADGLCYCAGTGAYTATAGGDCDDTSPDIHPKGLEICNGVDDDCDGITDPTGAEGCKLWFVDGDSDGYGNYLMASKCLCVGKAGYANAGGDCVDSDPAVNPKATEICNGKDDNCDGNVDPKNTSGCTQYYYDADGDGFGQNGLSECVCAVDPPFVATAGGDCNDGEAAINPGKSESCNAVDDNCNSQTDEGLPTSTWYVDTDKDGYGTGGGTLGCGPVNGANVTVNGDCNDSIATIHPGVNESCNGVDDNCNSQTDEGLPKTTWYVDGDGDGYGIGAGSASCGAINGMPATVNGDCNDGNPNVNPGKTEACSNGLDDNCNGSTDENCSTCTGGKSAMNGVCVDLTTAALNAGGRDTVTSALVSLYIVPPGNLLTNGGAETADFTGWVKPSLYDDWSVAGTDYSLPVPFGTHVFRSSYYLSYLAQTVDLLALSVPTAGLNANVPLQYGGFGMGWGCKDTIGGNCGTTYSDDVVGVDVTFQDAVGTQLGQWLSPTSSLTLGAWAVPFQADTTYPTGTRKLVFQMRAQDGESWAGYYGPSLDGAFVIYGKLDMRISNDGVAWSAWQPYQPVVPGWTLAPGAGVKTVRIEFRDGSGAPAGSTLDAVTLQ